MTRVPNANIATAWAVIYGATAVLGNMGTVSLGQANWTRLATIPMTRLQVTQAIALIIMTYTVCKSAPSFMTSKEMAAKLTTCSCSWNRGHICCGSDPGRCLLATISSLARDSEVSQQLHLRSSRRVSTAPLQSEPYRLTRTRFFASAVCAWAQICVNVILNSTAVSMDMQAYAPKWINIRRG